MNESPSLSNTLIDNIITRKEIRDDAIRRVRARDKIEVFDRRRDLWNLMIEVNSKSPASKFLIKQKLDNSDFPDHLALIPDGNRRWAWARGLTVGEGYAKGAERIKKFRKWALIDNNVDVLSVFLLSTENIERRPENQLEQLFRVFEEFFEGVSDDESVVQNGIKHEVRGEKENIDKLPDDVRNKIKVMEESTEDFSNGRMVFLIPYGSRQDIVKAARQTTSSPLSGGDIMSITERGEDSSEFRQNLQMGDLPDVDLMVRTSEKRISNFLLYENAYAELVFLSKNWPSFTESDFYESIYSYANRDRRFGV